MSYLIKNVTLPDLRKADIMVADGIITCVDTGLTCAHRNVYGDGMVLIPGLIDLHVHLREPGYEHKETIQTGCAAAAAGGVTTLCCMPNTMPVADNAEVLRFIQKRAAQCGTAHVLPIAAISRGMRGEALTDFASLSAAGACAFSDDGMPVMNRELMREAMLLAASLGKPIISHCEDFNFTEPCTARRYGFEVDLPVQNDEEAMVARDLGLALQTGAPIHIAHVSTSGSVELIRAAKALGARVTCETCPHYMLLTDEALQHKGSNAKMNPPLRRAADCVAIIEGLCDGTIDIIVTDHAPHSADEKSSANPPNGIIGLETLFSGAVTALGRRMTIAQIVDKMSTNTAKILGIEPPRIAEGQRADFALVSPDERWTLTEGNMHSKSRNTPFSSFDFVGKVKKTFFGGVEVYNG